MKVYNAESVDGFLKVASESMHALTDLAAGIQAENAELAQKCASLEQELAIAKNAAANKVELEKVAGAALNAGQVDEFMDMLIERQLVDASKREKFAAACAADASKALTVAMEAIKLSDVPAAQGRGIKSAANKPADPEREAELAAWKRVTESYSAF